MWRFSGAVVMSILISASLFAQNNRSAVSLTGNDAATCTVPDPCRTFTAALARTNSGGEVIVLSSAGYGPFTITQSVSIVSPLAYHAAIAPTSGDAITVSADNALVVVRGLTLNGGLGGSNGITFAGAATGSNTRIYVENCTITAFTFNGVNFARNGMLFISDLIARENGNAVFIDGSTGLPSAASIDHALMERSADTGLLIYNATVAVRDSVAAANNVGFWARTNVSGTTAELTTDNCQATHNFTGFESGGSAGTGVLTVSNSVAASNFNFGINSTFNGTVRASNNTVTRNGTGLAQIGSGVFRSRGNNTVDGNATETTGTITPFAGT